MIRSILCAIPILSMLLIACSGTRQAANAERCALTAADSVYLANGPVYRDCNVDRAAVETSAVRVEFNPPIDRYQRTMQCYRADLQFVIDANGILEPGTAKVVESNDGAFAAAALASLERRKFRPAMKDGQPVRQIVKKREGMATRVATVPVGQAPMPTTGTPLC